MMANPDFYYEKFLKGKNKYQINREISRLKKTIKQLEYIIENPDFRRICMDPSKSLQLSLNLEYLEKAKKAYLEVESSYKLSKKLK